MLNDAANNGFLSNAVCVLRTALHAPLTGRLWSGLQLVQKGRGPHTPPLTITWSPRRPTPLYELRDRADGAKTQGSTTIVTQVISNVVPAAWRCICLRMCDNLASCCACKSCKPTVAHRRSTFLHFVTLGFEIRHWEGQSTPRRFGLASRCESSRPRKRASNAL